MSSNVIVSRKIAVTRVNGPSVEFCPEINKRPPRPCSGLKLWGDWTPPPSRKRQRGASKWTWTKFSSSTVSLSQSLRIAFAATAAGFAHSFPGLALNCNSRATELVQNKPTLAIWLVVRPRFKSAAASYTLAQNLVSLETFKKCATTSCNFYF